ncbi:hypothetical protein [Polystyrenella longa]|uniref:hypothetical protein n=1 Tax=Polystyrenella longa TaxID=2528007 RepID=UPI0011A3394F|nr:hypothetical protein [Polystyrenella longa]
MKHAHGVLSDGKVKGNALAARMSTKAKTVSVVRIAAKRGTLSLSALKTSATNNATSAAMNSQWRLSTP